MYLQILLSSPPMTVSQLLRMYLVIKTKKAIISRKNKSKFKFPVAIAVVWEYLIRKNQFIICKIAQLFGIKRELLNLQIKSTEKETHHPITYFLGGFLKRRTPLKGSSAKKKVNAQFA